MEKTTVAAFESQLELRARGLGYQVNRKTQFVLLIGENLATSSFYKIFTEGFRTAGVNMVYLSCDTSANELGQRMELIRLSPRIRGCSITTPHKLTVMPYLDELAIQAQIVGAVNAVVRRDHGRLWGTTFDGQGWTFWFTKYLGETLAKRRLLVLGAGGAARSLVVSILQTAPDAEIVVYDLMQQRAVELQRAVAERLGLKIALATTQDLNEHITQAQVVANFTGLGKMSADDKPDLDYSSLRGKIAVDANYQPVAKNAFLQCAEASGARVYNGLGFLIGTIPPFFEALTGQSVDYQALLQFSKLQLGLKEALPASRILHCS